MGFYGNITNTSKTNFVFDKIYTNRKAMDENIATDGVFIGRYVLVEYGQITKDSFIRAYLINDKFYTTNVENTNTEILYTTDKNKVKDRYITNGIVIYTITKNNKNEDVYTYYECNGGKSVEQDGIYRPTFSETPGKDIENDPYFYNFNQDKAVEAYGGTRSRGYDGTVWVKTSINNDIKYVNIAELNSVVPSFDMVADAPTMSPILPHFDTASNNVYYKLHWQPAWGMRIAETLDGKDEFSDYVTSWSQEVYNKEGKTSTQWYFPNELQEDKITKGVWRTLKAGEQPPTINADIYFNKAAFDSQVGETVINKDVNYKPITLTSSTYVKGKYYYKSGNDYLPDNRGFNSSRNPYYEKLENYIGITADGLSGNEYNLHDGTSDTEQKPDTQQIHINLPAIGNMMSEAWDIIHGENRDNSTVDSLQGRLDFFKNEINSNEIPVQSQEGYLVGSVINGDVSYENSTDATNQDKSVYNENILKVEINSKKQHEHDDAWIATNIDTSQGKEGEKDYHRKAISIHHTFHPRTDSEINELNINNDNIKINGSLADSDTGFQKIVNKDTIQLYVPKVDKAGHVVGTDIDQIVLPYGYKHIKTIGNKTGNTTTDLDTVQDKLSDDKGTVTAGTPIGTTAIVANETQDTVNINPFNKWIQVKASDDKVEIAHEIHGIITKAKETDLNDGTNTITFHDLEFDAAGHVEKNQLHTYTLPYGFKTIKAATQSTAVTNPSANTTEVIADSTQDTLEIASSNKWIRMSGINKGKNSDYDTFSIGHEVHDIPNSNNNDTDLNDSTQYHSKTDGNTIDIPDWEYDEAGHIKNKHNRKYTLPYGFKTIKIGKQAIDSDVSNLAGHTSDTSVIADNTQDTLTILPANRWVCLHGTNDDTTNSIGDVIRVGHQVNTIITSTKNAVDLNNTLTYDSMTNGDTIKIPDWTYDRAGHIIAKQSRTYTLPYGYKTIIATNSEAIGVEPSSVTDQPTADSTQDILNIKAANKWIKLNTTNDSVADGNSISFAHTLVGTSFGNTYYSNVDNSNTNDDHNRNLDFGSTFKIFNLTTDNAGHITGIDTNNITLPTIALANNTSGNMVTDISYSYSNANHKGTFTETRANVGTLALTDYDGKATGNVSATDSINTAFAKVENKINTFLQDASVTEGAIDTLKELQNYISTHTTEAADMVAATNAIYTKDASTGAESGVLIDKTDTLADRIDKINDEVSADAGKYISSIKIENDTLSIGTTALPTLSEGSTNGTIKLGNGNDVKVKGLGTAAFTNSTDYATAAQGTLAQTAIQLDTEITYQIQKDDGEGNIVEEELKTTIKEMAKEIENLKQILKDNSLITE